MQRSEYLRNSQVSCTSLTLLFPPVRGVQRSKFNCFGFWELQQRRLSGHFSRDWSEYVSVIGVISEPFARELRIQVTSKHKSDCVNLAFSLQNKPVNEGITNL